MIVSIDEIMQLPEFKDQDEGVIKTKLEAVENLIRAYTNNNFQNRNIRFAANSAADRIYGLSEFMKVGDTVQISQSLVNNGLYVITEINTDEDWIRVDKELFTFDYNLVTKVEYPQDIKMGVINLLKWEIENRSKVGIKSETLSRYSVTYYDQDSNNSVMGYPVALLGFLKPYMKARF